MPFAYALTLFAAVASVVSTVTTMCCHADGSLNLADHITLSLLSVSKECFKTSPDVHKTLNRYHYLLKPAPNNHLLEEPKP